MSIVHFENFGDFGTQSDISEARPLAIDAPSVSLGFTMSIPGKFEGTKPVFKSIDVSEDNSVIKAMPTNETIQQLRDSLRYSKFQIQNLYLRHCTEQQKFTFH